MRLTIPELPKAKRGRKYLCMAPFAWGKADTAKEAVQNARKNFYNSYGTKWGYLLFDVPSDAYVDGMGLIHWEDGNKQIVEVHRQNIAKAKGNK